ncbi:hypothetical protein JCM10908_004154 [Rhodotorula pacifica]|uniref:uncharacterized protein n=1 Tax=Rhodotorula pacifica TaxID=1495444 RepID=UPI00316C0F51
MARTTLDCALEALPHEIKLAIASHLVPNPESTASLRRNAALTSFACASPSLYAEMGALVNAEITITDRVQVAKLVEAAPQQVRDQVRSVRLEPIAGSPWSHIEVDTLLRSLSQLAELRIQGGYSGTKRQLVESLASQQLRVLEVDFGAQPRSTSCTPSSSPRSSPARGVNSAQYKVPATRQATLPWNARADSPRPVPGAEVVAAALSPPYASDGSGNCSAQDSLRTSLSLKSRVCPAAACCYCCEGDCTSCFVRGSLVTCPSLVELRLANATASAPCEPCDRSLSSSIVPRSAAVPAATPALRSLRLEDCELSAADLTDLFPPSLDHLELIRCRGLSTTDIADGLKTSNMRLYHFAFETPASAPGSPSSSPRPAARSPPSSPRPAARITNTVDTLLPYLGHLESLTLVGDVLPPVTFANLCRHIPALQQLRITAHPQLTLSHLASVITDSSLHRLPHLRRLEYEPQRRNAAFSWCNDSSSEHHPVAHDDSRVAEDLWKAALAHNITLVGSPFRDLQDRFDWATRAAEKAGCRGDLGGSKRRKRPSLAREA